jgi:hypothetical protein
MTLRSRGTIPMLDRMVNAWSILDHETTPRQRTLVDEIYHSNMTCNIYESIWKIRQDINPRWVFI